MPWYYRTAALSITLFAFILSAGDYIVHFYREYQLEPLAKIINKL